MKVSRSTVRMWLSIVRTQDTDLLFRLKTLGFSFTLEGNNFYILLKPVKLLLNSKLVITLKNCNKSITSLIGQVLKNLKSSKLIQV